MLQAASTASSSNRKAGKTSKGQGLDVDFGGRRDSSRIDFFNPMSQSVDSPDEANIHVMKKDTAMNTEPTPTQPTRKSKIAEGFADAVNVAERVTGIDIDGDGDVGAKGTTPKTESRTRIAGSVTMSLRQSADQYVITILSCSDLKQVDLFAANDVRVDVTMAGHAGTVTKTTETIKDGGSAVQFGQNGTGTTLSFGMPTGMENLYEGGLDTFRVEVYDEDYSESDDLIGECVVPYADIVGGDGLPREYKLIDEKFDVNNFFKHLDEQANVST